MSEAVYDDIYDRIDALVEREKSLRLEIANIRAERSRLKSQLQFSDLANFKWISETPKEFWYPSYLTSKLVNNLRPNMEYRNTPPDLEDWQKGSGMREFFINTLLGIGIIVLALQVFFFLL